MLGSWRPDPDRRGVPGKHVDASAFRSAAFPLVRSQYGTYRANAKELARLVQTAWPVRTSTPFHSPLRPSCGAFSSFAGFFCGSSGQLARPKNATTQVGEQTSNLSGRRVQPVRPQPSSQPAILFDLDGTLVDTVYQHVVAWSTPLRSVGIVVPDWKIHRRVGMSGESMLRQLFREPEVRKRKVDTKALETKHDTEFTRLTRNVPPLPRPPELLFHFTPPRLQ